MLQNASPDVIKVLAGNKCDNESLRAVGKVDGEKVSVVKSDDECIFCYNIIVTVTTTKPVRDGHILADTQIFCLLWVFVLHTSVAISFRIY